VALSDSCKDSYPSGTSVWTTDIQRDITQVKYWWWRA